MSKRQMECLCIVCHRPLTPARGDRGLNPKAVFCTNNDGCCRSHWRDQDVKGRPLSYKYWCMRQLAAFNREQVLILSALEARFPEYARQCRFEAAELAGAA
jgi:hypothetical protein